MRNSLLAAGLALFLAADAAGAADALPQRARVKFQGNFDVKVSTPPRAPRRLDSREIASALSTAQSRAMAGTLILEGTFEGPAVTLRATGTGGVRPARLTGTRRNGQCNLITDDGSTRYDGPCGPQGFSGRISSTGAIRDTVSGTFTTTALSVVDIAAEEETRRKEAQLAAARRKAEAEQAAREVADLKAKAARGDTAAMLAMADRYESGEGVQRSGPDAVAMLVAASKKGSATARQRLKSDYSRNPDGSEMAEVVRASANTGEKCYTTFYNEVEPMSNAWLSDNDVRQPNRQYILVRNLCKRAIQFANPCHPSQPIAATRIEPGGEANLPIAYEYCGFTSK